MVQADMVTTVAATGDAATAGTPAGNDYASVATTQPGTGGTPSAQTTSTVSTNVLPGLRLSVIDTGLRLPVQDGGNASLETR